MPLTPLPGAATLTVKVSDFNAFVTALNAELAALEAKVRDLGLATSSSDLALEERINERLRALEDEPPVNIEGALSRIAALEAEADPVIPPDLTDRVAALEALIVRSPAESPGPFMGTPEPTRPPNLDTSQPQLVYNQATLYYGDVELHAQRIGERRWLLRARLNYIVISPAEWTYEEIIEGDPDEVYAHAQRRLVELAELKPQHDAVHSRVREMSEGRD